MQLKNAKDKQLEVSRSMKVTCLKQKTRFQTLESFLSVIDEGGKAKDISSRCADLDFVMREELGVYLFYFILFFKKSQILFANHTMKKYDLCLAMFIYYYLFSELK